MRIFSAPATFSRHERLIALESTANDTLRSINQSFLLFLSLPRSSCPRDRWMSEICYSPLRCHRTIPEKEIEYRSLLGDERASASLLLLLFDERMIKIDAEERERESDDERPFFPLAYFSRDWIKTATSVASRREKIQILLELTEGEREREMSKFSS